MKITKFGHCCLLVEEGNLRILTDPGCFSTAQSNITKIDVILITHEHADHIHILSLKDCIKNNPKVRVITNKGVAKLLDAEKIKYELVEHGQNIKINGVLIEGFGEKHAEIYKTITSVVNTGYFVANRLFYPGDALYNPKKPVDILALPVAGPWLKLSEVIDYAKEVKPKQCFPVHDAILKIPGMFNKHIANILQSVGIKFIEIEENKEIEV